MPTMYRVILSFLLMLSAFSIPAAAIAGESVTLTTADDVAVYATLTSAKADNDKVILLFHQANANRHEYDPVVPRLTALGYDTLATDQRAGGDLFGGDNKTVAELGGSTDYFDALPDLEAALEWAETQGYETIVTVGSSYSASLVILLAARYPQAVDALASFSPGEYFSDKSLVKDAAAGLTMPFYITAPPDEANSVEAVLQQAQGDNVTRYIQDAGVHGASTLVAARDPQGHEANMRRFTDFLTGLLTTNAEDAGQ